jgi:hypothetical protein
MPYDRFVITHIDPNADYGFVRQLTSSEGPVCLWPIAFTVSRPAQGLFADDDSIRGFRIPHPAILARVPEIGDELLGVIARDGSYGIAFDVHDNMFLRNWFYANQEEIFQGVDLGVDGTDADFYGLTSEPLEPDYSDEDLASDDPDDDLITDPDDLAEIALGKAQGMYNS